MVDGSLFGLIQFDDSVDGFDAGELLIDVDAGRRSSMSSGPGPVGLDILSSGRITQISHLQITKPPPTNVEIRNIFIVINILPHGFVVFPWFSCLEALYT